MSSRAYFCCSSSEKCAFSQTLALRPIHKVRIGKSGSSTRADPLCFKGVISPSRERDAPEFLDPWILDCGFLLRGLALHALQHCFRKISVSSCCNSLHYSLFASTGTPTRSILIGSTIQSRGLGSQTVGLSRPQQVPESGSASPDRSGGELALRFLGPAFARVLRSGADVQRGPLVRRPNGLGAWHGRFS